MELSPALGLRSLDLTTVNKGEAMEKMPYDEARKLTKEVNRRWQTKDWTDAGRKKVRDHAVRVYMELQHKAQAIN